MIGITEVVYCKDNGIMGIKRVFPFNFDVVVVNDPELRSILEELIEELWDSSEVKNLNCPRPGEQCNEFMCGSSVDGTCQLDIGTCEFCSDFMAEPKLKEINMYEGNSLNVELEYILDIERPDGFIPEKWRSKSLKINYCPICGRRLNNAKF